MNAERFCQLAEIYGSNLQRWPVLERDGAQALLDSGSTVAARALQQASELDNALDAHLVPVADAALIRQIRQSATQPEPVSLRALYAGWLPRLGFIGAGVAGIAAGILVMSLWFSPPQACDSLSSFVEPGCVDIGLTAHAEEID